MNNNSILNDERLWDYADGLLSGEEKTLVEAYIRQHPEWQERLDALLAEKRAWADLPLEQPDRGFADRVMAAWAAEQVQERAQAAPKKRDWIVYAVAGAFGLLILVPLMTIVLSGLSSAALPVNEIQLPDVSQITQLFSQSAVQFASLMGAAIGLLMLLDKYLHQRQAIQQLTV